MKSDMTLWNYVGTNYSAIFTAMCEKLPKFEERQELTND